MIPRIQNVFPARELYSSNPCRDFWENQQYSQGASGSQGSQQSSSELFSQSRMSQQKFDSLDVWSQPTNSQQRTENEPVKYYMKYMTQAPLFSSESEQAKLHAPSYKELIETQKKQAVEKENRDVLDNFISLLKDYTKEVKAAMDSFKDTIDSTLASKAEQVATATSQSADLITKLKEDLLEGFGCLRKDLKENEDLKEVISKQAEKIAEQSTQIKMLQTQLDDCRNREQKALEKQEKFLEREDKMFQKLEDMSTRQILASKHPTSMVQSSSTAGRQYFTDQKNLTGYAQDKQGMTIQQYATDDTEVCNSVTLHHMSQQATSLHVMNLQSQGHDQFVPLLNCPSQPEYHRHTGNAQCQNQSGYAPQNQQIFSHPTAAIAPMRPAANGSQPPPVEARNRPVNGPPGSLEGAALSSKILSEPASASVQAIQNPASGFTSPGARTNFLTTGAVRHKQSPIAAVHPQIHVKRENQPRINKVLVSPCAKRPRREDPFDIFVFDLTTSPDKDEENAKGGRKSVTKSVPKLPVRTYGTRSKKITQNENTSHQTGTSSTGCSNGKICEQKTNLHSHNQIKRKEFSSKSSGSNLRLTSCVALTSKWEKDEKDEATDFEKLTLFNTPNKFTKANVEDGIPRAKADHSNAAQRFNAVFRRNLGTAKRTLSFDASLLDDQEDSLSIQQITESIRKHAQRRNTVTVV